MDEDDLLERVRERASSPETRTDMYNRTAYPAADGSVISQAESQLGFELPSFYKRLLVEVANGGFGPGNGILGVPPMGYVDDDLCGDLVTAYQEARTYDLAWRWPRGVIALCNWGCARWSFLDCESPEGRVLTDDAGDAGMVFHETAASLAEWLAQWADGVNLGAAMTQVVGVREGLNPFTRKPIEIPIVRLRGPELDLEGRK